LHVIREKVLAVLAFLKATNAKLGEAFLETLSDIDAGLGAQTERKAMAIGGNGRGQLGLGTILAAFVVVIATFVVLIVVDEFDQSVGTPSSSSLSTAQGDILSGFSSMVSLVEPLLLIAIGVVIIGLIRRVQ
jgi:hypothetical protein